AVMVSVNFWGMGLSPVDKLVSATKPSHQETIPNNINPTPASAGSFNPFDSQNSGTALYSKSDNYVHNLIAEPVKNKKLQPVTKKVDGERVWLKCRSKKKLSDINHL
ncbi:MAG: hypothetical protein ACK51R_06040, partial [Hyphomonadaceae bacterium]